MRGITSANAHTAKALTGPAQRAHEDVWSTPLYEPYDDAPPPNPWRLYEANKRAIRAHAQDANEYERLICALVEEMKL